jgi:hypothetical protein
MRTKKEIKKQLEEVIAEYKTLPQYNYFGDDNWERRDIYIKWLTKAIEDKTFDAEEELDKMKDYYDDNFPNDENEKLKMDIFDWLLGNIDEI